MTIQDTERSIRVTVIEEQMTLVQQQAQQVIIYENFVSDPFPKRKWFFQIYQVTKRIVDICGAVVGLIVLGLLLPIVGFYILCEDRGPIFYQQVRVGKDCHPFFCYKFRTMIVDADNYLASHPDLMEKWRQSGKIQDDPRITRIGRFLRRTSLDELPQVINVLRGELSLVGPRPIQFSELSAFGELVALRHAVKPGLTGLWQVSGRSNTDYEQRAILDCTYAVECSFLMDMMILMKTPSAVFHGMGAY